jgi:acyl dehydratase
MNPRTSHRPTRALDDETIEAVRARIGIPQKGGPHAHIDTVAPEHMRNYAHGYGDDNPLYCDPEYGASTPWGTQIAPPMFPTAAGVHEAVDWTDEQKDTMRGGDPLAGMGQYMCGERWVFVRPVRDGTRVSKVQTLDSAELKPSAFGGGVGALLSHRIDFRDRADGELLAVRYLDFWHAEREKSRSTGKYRDLERYTYSPEEIAELDALYEAEQVRGSTPRRWEDVAVGDSLGVIAKGPFLLTDMITYHIGIGWGGFGGGTSKIAFKNRRRIPKFYTLNAEGVPDSVQRCHWDQEWAERLGHPAPYDYGAIRTNWMAHLITNWLGDQAWIWTMSATVTKFNYFGDSHRIEGSVTGKRSTENTAEVDVEVRGTNQRGDVTCRMAATLLLPAEHLDGVPIPAFEDAPIPQASAPGSAR